MKMFNVKKMVGALVACGMAMAYTAAPADAAFVLRVEDNAGNFVNVFDNNTTACTSSGALCNGGDQQAATAGWLSWSGVVGLFVAQVDSGLSKPLVPFPANPQIAELDLHFSGIAQGAGSLTLTLFDTNYAATNMLGTLAEHLGGTQNTGGTTTGQGWKDLTNGSGPTPCTPSANCITPGPLGPFSGPSYSGDASVNHGIVSAPFSMLSRVIVTSVTGGSYSGDFNLVNSSVPEPGSMLLLGTGLLGLARQARKRFAK